MKKSIRFVVLIIGIIIVLSVVNNVKRTSQEQHDELLNSQTAPIGESSSDQNYKMTFWDVQRKGTNFFNSKSIPENYLVAKDKGIEFVRLVPSKWTKGEHDFLIGDVENYTGLVMEDVDALVANLDEAEKAGIKVIVSTLSIPGLRYSQFNDNQIDLRIWKDKKYMDQTATFWKDLALVLKDHPAVVGYNIINEPQPERVSIEGEFWDVNYDEWYKGVENTSEDLNLLYERVIKSIREVDTETPIVLDSGFYATPWAFNYLKKHDDNKILYSFHMYEPYGYTTKRLNNDQYKYPGLLPTSNSNVEMWDKERMDLFFEPIRSFQSKYGISSNRILVGEFGCDRNVEGIEPYFSDMLDIYKKEEWSWAFYSFREDEWDAMDYELGKGKLKWIYWEAIENGENPPEECRVENPIWNVIQKHLDE